MVDFIKSTLAQNVTGTHDIVAPEHQFSLTQVPDQSGKVALVTGGSEGIGFACTHTLLSKNIAKLFILSLSKEVVDKATDAIREEMGEEAAKKVTWLQCDLSDWKKSGEVAFEIAKKTDRLDILINNAARGIMTRQLNDVGVDLHMAANHIGHVVLTSHLLPLLKKTAEQGNTVRIVNLASNAHQQAPEDCQFASLEELNKDYGPMVQYGRSKLATLLYSRYLGEHLTSQHPKILVNATHPGVVETRQTSEHILEAYPLGGYGMTHGLYPVRKDIYEGSVSTMFAATATEKSGQYICPPAWPEQGSPKAQDMKLAEQLMKLTREVVMEKTKSDSKDKGCPFKDY